MSVRTMLQPAYLAVMETTSLEGFREQVVRFSRGRGFDTVSAMLAVDHSPTYTEFHSIHNTPAGYSQLYDTHELAQLDPVMQHCKRETRPLVWDQTTYVAHGLGAKWEVQARFGLKTGVALALHMPGDCHFFIGAERDQTLPARPKALTRLVADLQLFAVHAQDAARRIFAPQREEAERPSLTARELEALRWTMDGQVAAEVGDTLNISTRTAVFHLQNATRKLGCKSKYQAVLTAIRLGLLA